MSIMDGDNNNMSGDEQGSNSQVGKHRSVRSASGALEVIR